MFKSAGLKLWCFWSAERWLESWAYRHKNLLSQEKSCFAKSSYQPIFHKFTLLRLVAHSFLAYQRNYYLLSSFMKLCPSLDTCVQGIMGAPSSWQYHYSSLFYYFHNIQISDVGMAKTYTSIRRQSKLTRPTSNMHYVSPEHIKDVNLAPNEPMEVYRYTIWQKSIIGARKIIGHFRYRHKIKRPQIYK